VPVLIPPADHRAALSRLDAAGVVARLRFSDLCCTHAPISCQTTSLKVVSEGSPGKDWTRSQRPALPPGVGDRGARDDGEIVLKDGPYQLPDN